MPQYQIDECLKYLKLLGNFLNERLWRTVRGLVEKKRTFYERKADDPALPVFTQIQDDGLCQMQHIIQVVCAIDSLALRNPGDGTDLQRK
jgi:hypothetical protein